MPVLARGRVVTITTMNRYAAPLSPQRETQSSAAKDDVPYKQTLNIDIAMVFHLGSPSLV